MQRRFNRQQKDHQKKHPERNGWNGLRFRKAGSKLPDSVLPTSHSYGTRENKACPIGTNDSEDTKHCIVSKILEKEAFRSMETETFIAHIAEDGRIQTLAQHLCGTAALCERFASEFDAGPQGHLVGKAHDVGKYSKAFQRRIRGADIRVDHATAGAAECVKRNHIAEAFAVAGHHGGLPDGGTRTDAPQEPTLQGCMRRAREGLIEPYDAWQQEIALPDAGIPEFCRHDALALSFYIRMLYSCLVDADFLDTEAFMRGEERDSHPLDAEALWEKLMRFIGGWFPPRGALNEKRCDILRQCMEGGNGKRGLYTLTVPTGGGKTVASMAFALAHARRHGMKRIIYVIPYTSIIEQTAQLFRRIFGAEAILEHHSNAGYAADAEEMTKATADAMRAAENWDMPVVVTTAVQFFESLYANRPSRCRKLHNLANAVILFDEAQMLPLNYLRPCVAGIAQLVAHYGATAVLCTATQPALAPLFAELLPGQPATELCPAALAQDAVFRRTTFRRAGMLSWEALAGEMTGAQQALCIVNSRQNALRLFALLDGDGCFCLTTLMAPAHRRSVLEQVRQRLRAGERCLVAATSLIEAGVDVDFPTVFREEAGLDSVLQAAGRCNREGKRPAAESVVTVFRAEKPPPKLFQTAIGAARTAMAHHDDFASAEAIEAYFRELLDLKGQDAQDVHRILLRMREPTLPFRSVAAEFRLIESDTRTIYVPWGDGKALIARYQNGERTKSLYRELGQYAVNVYEQHFKTLCDIGALELQEDGAAILLWGDAAYSEEVGLRLEPEGGQAEFI